VRWLGPIGGITPAWGWANSYSLVSGGKEGQDWMSAKPLVYVSNYYEVVSLWVCVRGQRHERFGICGAGTYLDKLNRANLAKQLPNRGRALLPLGNVSLSQELHKLLIRVDSADFRLAELCPHTHVRNTQEQEVVISICPWHNSGSVIAGAQFLRLPFLLAEPGKPCLVEQVHDSCVTSVTPFCNFLQGG